MTHTLIIDDNQSNINVLGLLLEQAGVGYSAIYSPAQLDEALQRVPQVDVVFLDLEFPAENGLTLLPQIKGHPRLANVPIIAYSVHTSQIDLVRRAGFDGFLGKPLDSVEFPNLLRNILKGASVWET